MVLWCKVLNTGSRKHGRRLPAAIAGQDPSVVYMWSHLRWSDQVCDYINFHFKYGGIPFVLVVNMSCVWYSCVCHAMTTCFSCVRLCNPMDCSPPGSSVHGILQARILEWVAISSSRGSPPPRYRTCISCVFCIGRQILYHWATWKTFHDTQHERPTIYLALPSFP